MPDNSDRVLAEYLTSLDQIEEMDAEQERVMVATLAAGRAAQSSLGQPDLLTTAKRQGLQDEAAAGIAAQRQLLEAHLRLVVVLARRYEGGSLDLLSLIQDGNLGLIKALEKFDPAKGYRFATYATWWIRQAITAALSKAG